MFSIPWFEYSCLWLQERVASPEIRSLFRFLHNKLFCGFDVLYLFRWYIFKQLKKAFYQWRHTFRRNQCSKSSLGFINDQMTYNGYWNMSAIVWDCCPLTCLRACLTISINSFVLRVFLHQISINSFERNKILKINLSESRNE